MCVHVLYKSVKYSSKRYSQVENTNIYFYESNIMTDYNNRISFLPQNLYEFALSDKDIELDIIEQELDREEILDLVAFNYQLTQQSKPKRKITMTV